MKNAENAVCPATQRSGNPEQILWSISGRKQRPEESRAGTRRSKQHEVRNEEECNTFRVDRNDTEPAPSTQRHDTRKFRCRKADAFSSSSTRGQLRLHWTFGVDTKRGNKPSECRLERIHLLSVVAPGRKTGRPHRKLQLLRPAAKPLRRNGAIARKTVRFFVSSTLLDRFSS